MKKTKIIWDAEPREIPGYGVPSKGDVLNVPNHMAESFVTQGLAVKPKAKQENVK